MIEWFEASIASSLLGKNGILGKVNQHSFGIP